MSPSSASVHQIHTHAHTWSFFERMNSFWSNSRRVPLIDRRLNRRRNEEWECANEKMNHFDIYYYYLVLFGLAWLGWWFVCVCEFSFSFARFLFGRILSACVYRSRKRKSICRRHHNNEKKLKHTATIDEPKSTIINIRGSFHQMKKSEALAADRLSDTATMWIIAILSICVICTPRVWSANSVKPEWWWWWIWCAKSVLETPKNGAKCFCFFFPVKSQKCSAKNRNRISAIKQFNSSGVC